jgi:DNA-binding IclR family transcriptional regulator
MRTDLAAAPEPALRTVDRALALLSHLGERPGAHALSELAADLGMNKAVLHRLLKTMEARGYVVQDARRRRYGLGPAARRLAQSGDSGEVRTLARETMHELARSTNLSTFLTVPLANDAVCVERAESSAMIRVSYEVGRRHPYHAGAPGKALLAHLDEAHRDDVLRRRPLTRFTRATTVSVTALRRELDTIRKRGYAVSVDELEAGISGVAAVILDAADRPLAALSVAAPTGALGPRALAGVGERLVAAAHEVSRRLGRAAEPRALRKGVR